MEDDTPMNEDISLETENPRSNIYIPPSVDETAVLSGDSYTYYSPIPQSLSPIESSSLASSSATTTATTAAQPQLQQPQIIASPDAPAVYLGVDEAGRGPVLGPMVYGAYYVPVAHSDPLLRETHHFDDSKVLTAATRTALMRAQCDPASDLATTCGFAIRALSARDISIGMLSVASPYNLNSQAFDATVEIVRGVIARGVRVEELFVDTVGQPAAYQAKLTRVFPGIKITVAKKADSLYPCVSAASVCAKVTRDAALEVLCRGHKAATGQDKGPRGEDGGAGDQEKDEPMIWGSGYPSDRRCVSWMRNNMHPVFGWGTECRFDWNTAKDMLEGKNGIKVDWPVEENKDSNRMTDYFASADREKDSDELGTWFGRPAGLEAF